VLRARRLDEASARAAEVLARAFFDDPGFLWVFPDARAERLAWHYARVVVVYARVGVRTFMEGEDAVACWMPPGLVVSALDFVRGGMVSAPLHLSVGGTARALYGLHRLERLRARVTRGRPHWYLDQLAVDPPAQGRGLGRRLLTEGLATLVEPGGLPCYLVTTKASNVAFYRGSGFNVAREERIGGFHAWGMIREPAPSPPR
jgi:ribosomal protein S18 acetylase RimI-like enzyme